MIGVSGGLDSTHALIVAARAMDRLGLPRTDILAFTMPGFATSDHTRGNATALATALGVTFAEIDITDTARLMLDRLDHPFADGEPVYDVTFENVQAGLRTDYLFRLANQHGGFVLGTGDLSELALGWCTYGVGDQMSHYDVNGGVPKTLIQHLIRWVIGTGQFDDAVRSRSRRSSTPRSRPNWCRSRPARCPSRPRRRSDPMRCTTSSCSTSCATAPRPSKVAFLAWHAWQDAAAGSWPEGFPHDEQTAYDLATVKKLARRLLRALLRLRPVQALGTAERSQGGAGLARCHHAGTGEHRPTPRPHCG